MRSFIILGLGNFGSSVAEALHAQGHEVIAVDSNPDAVNQAVSYSTESIEGNGTDPKLLEKVGAKDVDVAIISTGDDITASVLSCLALKDLGLKEIYVKVISEAHARVMEKLGVSETVFPERDSGIRLAKRMESKSILNYVQVGPGFIVQEMEPKEEWLGKSLQELHLRRDHNVSVLAFHNVVTNEMIGLPDPSTPLRKSDTLLVAGREEDVQKLTERKG